ncbi:hypothetical protein AOLI_G00206410 [Acnodon oligacanthus]
MSGLAEGACLFTDVATSPSSKTKRWFLSRAASLNSRRPTETQRGSKICRRCVLLKPLLVTLKKQNSSCS